MAEVQTTHRLPKNLFFKQIIRKIFLEDWLVKLVALGVTLALWLGVTGLSTPTTTRLSAIPLSLRFTSDTEVTNTPITEIDVIISGDNRKIAQINKNDLVASVDLTGIAPGDRVIQLTGDNVRLELPLGVRLDEITPSRMAVRLEAVDVKEVPVKVEVTGNPPDGFEVYSQNANPVRVRVRGPLSLTKPLSQVMTEKVDLEGKNADFIARQTPLTSPNPKLTLLETSVVDVNVRIGERRIERTLTVPANDGSGKRVSVTLFGSKTELSQLKAEDIQVEIVKNSGVDSPEITLPSQLQQTIEIRKSKLLP